MNKLRVMVAMVVVILPNASAWAQVSAKQKPVTVTDYVHDGWSVKALTSGKDPGSPSILLQNGDQLVLCALQGANGPPGTGGDLAVVKTAVCYKVQ
jgi:hypothetical protein